jgi:cytochrome c oxidase assembly protein subunit 15
LLALIVFQALLGMWTVTLLLKPMVVTAHLLGGVATLSLLLWLPPAPPSSDPPQWQT